MNVRLKNEIRIMGNQEGILENPQVTYPKGMASWYCWSRPLKGWKMPS
jgi:hypothetical protein